MLNFIFHSLRSQAEFPGISSRAWNVSRARSQMRFSIKINRSRFSFFIVLQTLSKSSYRAQVIYIVWARFSTLDLRTIIDRGLIVFAKFKAIHISFGKRLVRNLADACGWFGNDFSGQEGFRQADKPFEIRQIERNKQLLFSDSIIIIITDNSGTNRGR